MQYMYESDNLRYEILGPEDAEKMLHFYEDNREIFDRYEPEKPNNFYTLEYHQAMAKLEQENYLRSRGARYWISRKNYPGVYVGNFNISNIVKGSFQYCNIAYKIHKVHQRQGYATEAITFLSQKIFEDMKLHRIEAYVHPTNTPSLRTIEKCGFECAGLSKEYVYMHGKWEDHWRYTLIHEEG